MFWPWRYFITDIVMCRLHRDKCTRCTNNIFKIKLIQSLLKYVGLSVFLTAKFVAIWMLCISELYQDIDMWNTFVVHSLGNTYEVAVLLKIASKRLTGLLPYSLKKYAIILNMQNMCGSYIKANPKWNT